ncbi:hypothetical protein PAXRUDRAFT_822685 [Paxillus rubicundulus Ve08.2h10]|uniref:Uncharacterized protein n=1 Tax=Paxillus rubicundulus Ve08.2h10 TaxID=930991 RepID=A0A0D0ECK4_9AGAM|nr:hypothetical protein PAXRUDRAFT_822685 [Paxillus rubicundulus Ve08.2h10]
MPGVDAVHQRMITARSIHREQTVASIHKWDILDCSAMIAGWQIDLLVDASNHSERNLSAVSAPAKWPCPPRRESTSKSPGS